MGIEEEVVEEGGETSIYAQLLEAFRLTSYGALKTTTRDEFMDCFPEFTPREQEKLYHIFTRVVAKIQKDLMIEFKPQCEVAEVKEALVELEALIQNHEQDGGMSNWCTPLTEAVREVTKKIKEDEVDKLKLLVPQGEEQTAQLRVQLEALRAQCTKEPTPLADMFAKVKEARAELLLASSAHHNSYKDLNHQA